MSIHRVKAKPAEREDFPRVCITIPADLVEYANEAKRRPAHAGNFSSYVRSLIIGDREANQRKKAA